jgi:sec-independent protein translocase protein TatA
MGPIGRHGRSFNTAHLRASLKAMGIENPVHLAFIAIVALLVLGPKRLPELARALGHGIREFREAVAQPAQHPHDPAEGQVTAEPHVSASAGPVDPAQPVRSGDAPDRGPL